MRASSTSASQAARDAAAQICDRSGLNPATASETARRLIALLPHTQTARGYRDLGAAFYEQTTAAQAALQSATRGDILNLIVTELATDFDARFARARLPESLLPYYQENLSRILNRAATDASWASSPHNDIFLKDLGILRMTLIPCASHLVFRNSGVPRRLVLRQAPKALFRALCFFAFRAGGFQPFLENHVHPAMLTHFNPAGRERCFQLVAQLLERWPESKGLMGLSWYYDPRVGQISSHLGYLHDVPAHGGALFLPAGSGPEVAGDATAKSSTRRKLVQRGDYTPTRYLMAWARRDILERYAGRA